MVKLSCSKPFHNTLNYASTANIEEVMKFCNLGHKTFETDFRFYVTTFSINIRGRAYQIWELNFTLCTFRPSIRLCPMAAAL